ncbi:MAG: HAMP domain-containing protein, partial [Desulfobacterota bacterium]|nr:HAMP domain-containing protein [Thermodesulfobacteriota bacterium]
MRRPIFFKLLAGFLVVNLTLAALILAASYEVIQTHYLRFTEQKLEHIGIPLRDVVTPLLMRNDTAALNSLAREYGPRLDLRITIIDTTGMVLADSERDPATLENHLDRPEMMGALEGDLAKSIRYSRTLDENLLYIALPARSGGKTIGVLRLSLALSAVFSHLLSTPMRALSRAALRVAGGDFSVRVPPSSNDEIRDLTDGFNSMAGRLENSFAELKARKEELEGIISSITDLLLVLVTQGRVLMFNDAARKIITSDTVQGRF